MGRVRCARWRAHKNYRDALGSGYRYDEALPSGRRPDAVDWQNRVVRELTMNGEASTISGDQLTALDDTEQYAAGGVYVNFVPDGEAPIDAAYAPNYERSLSPWGPL